MNKVKKPENYPCRLYKVYINNIGFVWEKKEREKEKHKKLGIFKQYFCNYGCCCIVSPPPSVFVFIINVIIPWKILL